MAYVAQQAWIQNATLKDNVLFTNADDGDKFDNILDACALKPDLDILPGREMTEIGEKVIQDSRLKIKDSRFKIIHACSEKVYTMKKLHHFFVLI